MNPRLIAISGSLKGTIFALADDEVLIGRELSNAICLNEPSVSRRHCLIKREPTESDSITIAPALDGKEFSAVDQAAITHRFVISDLESYNGTFVNGLPIREQLLMHGDQIAVGDVVLLFLLHQTEAGTKTILPTDEDKLITRSTVRLRAEDALYLRPEKVLAELPATARVARDLNALLKISTTINSISDLPRLQRELLQLILEVIPAEREAILLLDTTQGLFTSVCGWNKLRGQDDSIKASQNNRAS
jgi:pSer/pThr/pTyr-binding forkhead associated (FHA) protein